MSNKASSSQSSIGFSMSSTMSHAYIQYPPMRCSITGSRGLFYDDGNKLLISPTSDQVYLWKTTPFSPHEAPTSDPISEGPILSIRYSLDARFRAIQRSSQEIQFWQKETGDTFNHKCKSESESILGFFWTDCPLGDIVLVKTSGLDLLSFDSESKSLQLVETRRLNVSWYVYTHESRLVLLASGMQCKSFTGFQLSTAGIIRLPRFEMVMAKTEANNKPVLSADDVYIVTVYGRIYCLQIDRVAMLLHSYRFYRDAVVQQGSLPIYSSKIAISVVDNVLLVHQVEAKVVILYDIFADSRAPISAPLPLLFRGLPRISSSSRSNGKEGESSEVNVTENETIVYGDDWTFLVPDLICDVSNKLLWKIHLDLEAISASSSEVPSILEFLQRRKLEASKTKQLCLGMTRTAILERRPVTMVARVIEVLVSSYAHALKTGTYPKGTKPEMTSSSSEEHSGSPRYESTGRVDALGKSVKHESNAGINNKSPIRSSNISTSESEDNTHFESLRINSPLQKVVKENFVGTQISTSEVQPTSFQSQHLGLSSNPLKATDGDRQDTHLTSPVISPDDLYNFVFAPVEEELVGDPSYLVAIIVEYLRSANAEKIKVHPDLFVLTIQLLARSERYSELVLSIINKVLEPSKEVAMQLMESGRQNFHIRKLGLDMLRQLSLHHDYVVLLAREGYYLEALRYARKHKVNTIQPTLFLEAALASNDSQVLAAVLRFFGDFMPGFRNSMDHRTYARILNEMSSITAT
ncbi:hypothetical protein K2173_005678 [Erythroxylum novogranatense]|uniref:Mic1 domain-containing protein n=1 Tax=Erythroxylum novogranatense TaxID=1862640 RepID=A0AAV8SQG7_9ROSI|nr:hypothetical protein K2173_005678 [Erythroxylum novogranatense]